ncbi:MAG: DUF2314 domain-containing protein [Planctomycetota bacterium]
MSFSRLFLVAACLLAGCEHEPVVTHRAPEDDAAGPPRPMWVERDGSEQATVAVDDEELADAIAEARRTAEDARRRWDLAPLHERPRWAVKWHAPTADGGHEYVWVEPMHWSLFRVEGRLASPPRRELACGRRQDELVSFPSAELADWIYRPAHGPHEGGFTVNVLEGRFADAPVDQG